MAMTVAHDPESLPILAAKRSKMPIWALLGPTGVGKSALALAAAEACQGAILNCDSVQCYAGFDVGSAKAEGDERARAPHHLLDLVDLRAGAAPAARGPLHAQRWRLAAHQCLAELAEQGQQALLVGGTGLYLRALRQGLIEAPPDEALRAKLLAEEARAPGILYRRLAEQDRPSAERIGPHNVRRLLRALEITMTARRPVSEVWQRHGQAQSPGLDVRLIVLDAPRPWLFARLLARAERMLERGLLAEVSSLLAEGVEPDAPPMRAVGYREACAVVLGKQPLARLAERMAIRSWQYARRQRTWLRRESAIAWLEAPKLAELPIEAAAQRLVDLWRQNGA